MDLEEEMRIRGISIKEMARRVGVCEGTVRSWIRGQPMSGKNLSKTRAVLESSPKLLNPPKATRTLKPLWTAAERKMEAKARKERDERRKRLEERRKRKLDDELCTSTATFKIGAGFKWQIAEATGNNVWWEPVNCEEWKEEGKPKYCLVLAMYGTGFHASLIKYDDERNAYMPTDVEDGEGYLASQAIEKLKRNALYKRIRIIYKGDK